MRILLKQRNCLIRLPYLAVGIGMELKDENQSRLNVLFDCLMRYLDVSLILA